MAKSLLIVDDELDIQSSLGLALKDEGFEVFTATLPKEAQEILERESIDLGLFDVWFPEGDGLELLEWTQKKFPETKIVMMSGHGNIELALKAIRQGAYDFLEKPLELEKVLVVLRNASESQSLAAESQRLMRELESRQGQLIGDSQSMSLLRGQIDRVARASTSILLQGENGSGKELVAKLLHEKSERNKSPFVAVNCASVPDALFESEFFGHERGAFTGALQRRTGRFEEVQGGTLFLDEIAEMSLAAQSKLLRVLEDKKFRRLGGQRDLLADFRLVAATNRDLQAEVKSNRFREDLYHRLKVVLLSVPPLRDRGADILLLGNHFLKYFCFEHKRSLLTLSDELAVWLKAYDWPGNVRELKNLVERMVIFSDPAAVRLDLGALPDDVQNLGVQNLTAKVSLTSSTGDLRSLRASFERNLIEERLKSLDGNVSRTATSLGIERVHLHRKMRQLGIGSAS